MYVLSHTQKECACLVIKTDEEKGHGIIQPLKALFLIAELCVSFTSKIWANWFTQAVSARKTWTCDHKRLISIPNIDHPNIFRPIELEISNWQIEFHTTLVSVRCQTHKYNWKHCKGWIVEVFEYQAQDSRTIHRQRGPTVGLARETFWWNLILREICDENTIGKAKEAPLRASQVAQW